MRRNGYLWTSCVTFRHRRSISRARFPIKVQNFTDLVTFFVDLCIFYADCLLYFYFRFVWPTVLESIPQASILTKFEVDITTHCRVTDFLSAHTSRDLVTLTFDLLILNSCHSWQVTWQTLPPSMKTCHGEFQSWQCEFFKRTKAPLGWTALILDVSEETTIGTNLRNSFNISYCLTIKQKY